MLPALSVDEVQTASIVTAVARSIGWALSADFVTILVIADLEFHASRWGDIRCFGDRRSRVAYVFIHKHCKSGSPKICKKISKFAK